MDDLFIDGKPVVVKSHAIKRAREREIAYPNQVYDALTMGRMMRFGKNMITFVKKAKKGSIICIGEDLGHTIIIKTIERGN